MKQLSLYNIFRHRISIVLLVSIFFIGCKPKKNNEFKEEAPIIGTTAYIHANGTICTAQSPINILSFNATDDERHSITFHFRDEINAVENLGHTVQLDFKEGSTIVIDNKVYDFKQLHFHTPSEHLIDGVTYPMEMHIVNTLQGQKEGEETEYLVIGLLFKMGAESKFIHEFIDYIPKEEHSLEKIDKDKIQFADLISETPESILNHYYHYKGSLTTPPYTESVQWYVSKSIFEASPEQILKILEIEGTNARHIQSLNQRKLESK